MSAIETGTRVLLPNYQGRTFVYGIVEEIDGPNAKVRLERPSFTERDPFWTSVTRLVRANTPLICGPAHPVDLARRLGIRAIDTRAAILALTVRTQLGFPT